ncbi:hypothetical protein Z517_09144 [Fonsecaea pedrosoi CBS 271.37]|uniref:FAD-dependent oxidoreductase 2 FAD-binding domain-containing protein n=1 Tax=Fonsecaea pedrosoi CBS 271.37 TaxID=1442368 RepID=A0A0D2GDD5_9EURO|nr:uncharacterized protein Z517_09144 [Fonsecaea pedrosoi CBS 271.37]KIW76700.1 hypothetical protein Z517_09144 [Fonsecaea pedrosoi CBS 271.37]
MQMSATSTEPDLPETTALASSSPSQRPQEWDVKVDFLIAGSGGAGLSAALKASRLGLVTLVVEGSKLWGGTTAYSAGGVWVPNNPLMREAGVEDSIETAMTYIQNVVGEPSPESTIAKRQAYVRAGAEMVKEFRESGFRWHMAEGFPDYHAYEGSRIGRHLTGEIFDLNKLGPWRDTMRVRPHHPELPAYLDESARMLNATRTRKGFTTLVKVVSRMLWARLRGAKLASMGMAIPSRLLYVLQQFGVPIWRNTQVTGLITDQGRVVGASVSRDGRPLRIQATRGVLLALGGFARNDALRRQYGQASSKFTMANPDDQGTGIQLGQSVGAEVAHMNGRWGVPMMFPPGDNPVFNVWERASPHSIMVNKAGKRFTNEAGCYQDVANDMDDLGHNPCWLIFDASHRKKYAFGDAMPGFTPKRYFEENFMIKTDSLVELANKCEVDAAQLRATVARFNEFAVSGIDEDFRRGENPYDRYYADPTHHPNNCIGKIEKPPFYAVRLYVGDVGTKGGLRVDEHWRVLRKGGKPIPGLYAAGNTTSTLFGRRYPGPGSTIGPAMIGGFIAASHAGQIA